MELARTTPERLAGAVLLAPVHLPGRTMPKGARLDGTTAAELIGAAPSFTAAIRLGWPDPGDLHEDEAAARLAGAVAGPGLGAGVPHQSRIDLAACWDGVLRVDIAALADLNRVDPLEVFTLFHGQAVRAGQVVASVKVAPHLVSGAAVEMGEAVASRAFPLLDVAPYRPIRVAAIAAEALTTGGLERFDTAAHGKTEALGGRFAGTTLVANEEPAAAEAENRAVLERLVIKEQIPLVLVGGVSAGDPLAPFYAALRSLGGELVRRGVPAHPGSMIWLARLGDSVLLGLPQCGMFSMATAADLVLPRLMTGERVTADTLADLGHGGLLGKEMRFRFPAYARDLEAPEG